MLRRFGILKFTAYFGTNLVTDVQEDKNMMSTDLLYVEGSIEKRPRIFRPSNIRSTFYIENTSRKLLCKLKDQDKNNVKNEIDCSNCNAVYFDES